MSMFLRQWISWLGAELKCLTTVRQSFEGSDVIETKAQRRTVFDQSSRLKLDEYAGQVLDAQRQIVSDNPACQRVGDDVWNSSVVTIGTRESDEERRNALNWVSLTRRD